MTTFSQVVDELVLESLRPELKTFIGNSINQVIRELHAAPKQGGAILFNSNLVEVQITTTVEQGHEWEITNPQLFQRMGAVRFDVFGTGKDAFAKERTPASMYIEDYRDKLYYRTGQSYSFVNYGGLGATISLAYFEFPRRLTYYESNVRPAVWNPVTDAWAYLAEYDVSDAARLNALRLTTNWVLQRWLDLVMQGVRAKIFARIGDEARAPIAYSNFESMRQDMISSETYTENLIHGGR